MEWAKAISTAIEYIENNIAEDISAEDIARQVNISPFYFQKGFSLLCGYTVMEYIRSRRLALAAGELVGGAKVIDTAIKYCYDSPEPFSRNTEKAFLRFGIDRDFRNRFFGRNWFAGASCEMCTKSRFKIVKIHQNRKHYIKLLEKISKVIYNKIRTLCPIFNNVGIMERSLNYEHQT